MIITSVAHPIYCKADRSAIDCTITFDNGETYPYTAVPNDSTDYGIKLWEDLMAGVHGSISAFPGVPEAKLLAALADYRYEVQNGGITVDGHIFDTDAESRSALTAAYVLATLNPAYTCNWKTATGEFVTLDAAGIIVVGNAILAFIQKCFDMERTLVSNVAQFNSAIAITTAFDGALAA